LAGRRRFYKHVGIAPIAPPSLSLGKKTTATTTTTTTDMVDSPISAGVDGTQSASGVHTSITNVDLWLDMLNPRRYRSLGDNSSSSSDSSSSDEESSLSWYTITLDGRTLRTPLGLPLSIPSLHLALAIASEWDAQKTHLRPAQMPLMTLCCTTLDQVANNPSSHQIDILRYLANDTTCYYANPNNSKERPLYTRQCSAWDGLHSHVITTVLKIDNSDDNGGGVDDVQPACAMGEGEAISLSRRNSTNSNSNSSSTSSSSTTTTSNIYSGLPHPPILITAAQQWVQSLDAWTLTALYSACVESKSFFVGAALIHTAMNNTTTNSSNSTATTNTDNIRDGTWAVNAARVEEEFNIECWGLVEGGHDYDRLNCSVQMVAASFMVRTVSNC
jgi:ATP synthase F1 complex assembly factor 2